VGGGSKKEKDVQNLPFKYWKKPREEIERGFRISTKHEDLQQKSLLTRTSYLGGRTERGRGYSTKTFPLKEKREKRGDCLKSIWGEGFNWVFPTCSLITQTGARNQMDYIASG